MARPIASPASSALGDRDHSGMAGVGASVSAVATLTPPAIAIPMPSAGSHHRDPLITLSSPYEYTGSSGSPTSLETGAPSLGMRPSKKKLRGRRGQWPGQCGAEWFDV